MYYSFRNYLDKQFQKLKLCGVVSFNNSLITKIKNDPYIHRLQERGTEPSLCHSSWILMVHGALQELTKGTQESVLNLLHHVII